MFPVQSMAIQVWILMKCSPMDAKHTNPHMFSAYKKFLSFLQ